MKMMHQNFYWDDSEVTVLFKELRVTSWWGLLIVAITFVLLGGFHEVLRCFRTKLAHSHAKQRLQLQQNNSNESNGPFTVHHAVQTLLHLVEFCSSFALMLLVMSYNAWILIAVVTGTTIGYQICHLISPQYDYKAMPRAQCVPVKGQIDPTKNSRCGDDNVTDVWMQHGGRAICNEGSKDTGVKSIHIIKDSEFAAESTQLIASL